MRDFAAERGHADIAYLLDLAVQMAGQRQNPAAFGPASWALDPRAGRPIELGATPTARA